MSELDWQSWLVLIGAFLFAKGAWTLNEERRANKKRKP
jgi:hypothetical protein